MAREKSYIYPTVLVFKTSNRSNAKTKMKTYKTKNVDEIIDALEKGTLAGVPKNAEILDIGLGKSFIEKYKKKHDLFGSPK
tara:strand:+ start:347 stop:589 length:243 start_codon:yes stop_codon:yes gene_type:complete